MNIHATCLPILILALSRCATQSSWCHFTYTGWTFIEQIIGRPCESSRLLAQWRRTFTEQHCKLQAGCPYAGSKLKLNPHSDTIKHTCRHLFYYNKVFSLLIGLTKIKRANKRYYSSLGALHRHVTMCYARLISFEISYYYLLRLISKEISQA